MSVPAGDDPVGAGPPWWLAVAAGAAAGAMGWGIRGQYGHETGAMVPGLLVCASLVVLFAGRASSLTAARAVALGALGFSLGGVMTYGQTVGLTHDVELRGDWAALRWGMLGLGVKGGLWIGVDLSRALGHHFFRSCPGADGSRDLRGQEEAGAVRSIQYSVFRISAIMTFAVMTMIFLVVHLMRQIFRLRVRRCASVVRTPNPEH